MRNAKSSIRVKRPKCSEVPRGAILPQRSSVWTTGDRALLLKGQIPIADVRQGVAPAVTEALETFSSKYSRDL